TTFSVPGSSNGFPPHTFRRPIRPARTRSVTQADHPGSSSVTSPQKCTPVARSFVRCSGHAPPIRSTDTMAKKYVLSGGFLCLLAGLLLGTQLTSTERDETIRARQKLEEAFVIMKQAYVDDVAASELAEN